MATIERRKRYGNSGSPAKQGPGENERSPEKAAGTGKGSESQEADSDNIVEIIRKYFGPSNGVDLELPPREPMRDPPTFD